MEAAIAGENLVVACRHSVTLTPADVRFLWSEYTDAGHGLMLAFLDRYLCSGPSEVLLLTGPDAFEGARRVKRFIRSRYANGPFANLVHTAERHGELARQAHRLLGDCAADFISDEPLVNPVRPAGRDFRADVDVPGLVDALWPAVQDPDPPAPGPHRLDGRSAVAAVWLGADRSQSFDATVTAVWSALPGVALSDAVLLTLYASRVGGHPIGVGGRRAVDRSHQVLLSHGLTACGTYPL